MVFLESIVSDKVEEARLRRAFGEDSYIGLFRKRRSLASALMRPGMSFICEIKRASPSEGKLADVDAASVAREYESAGASAISVLTDGKQFGGSLEDVYAAKQMTDLPILRKDFIVHKNQIREAYHYGADAVLLIVAILGEQTREFVEYARYVGLECLVEVHGEGELNQALASGARIIGVNNRDLRTLKIDLGTTERIAPLIPKNRIIVAESGIATRADVVRMEKAGAKALLIGSSLMKSANIHEKLKELRG
jgi:indole-3-glycerol phosphate synthase